MNDHDDSIPDDDLRLPLSLQGELDALYRLQPAVPTEIDASILTEARAGLSRRLWFRRTLQWSAAVAASAAAVLLAIRLSIITAPPAVPLAQNIPGDIDHNGRVDILDAYLLARRLDAHREPPQGTDFNRDGKINGADVEAIAAAAVRLPEGAVQ